MYFSFTNKVVFPLLTIAKDAGIFSFCDIMITGIIHHAYSRNCLKTHIIEIIYEDINEYKPKLSRIVIEMGFYKDYSSKRTVLYKLFCNSSAPPPDLPHRGGGNVFPRPWREGLGEGGELIHSFNVSITQRSRNQLTTPVSPPSQGGDKRGGKKTCQNLSS